MSLPVSLDEIVEDLQMQMDETTVYLQEEKGRGAFRFSSEYDNRSLMSRCRFV